LDNPGGAVDNISVKSGNQPRIGIVLSGGGSRGAYEVGILDYLRTDLARRLGHHVKIDIITGTSVGAINAAFMAATMDDPAGQTRRIVDAWRALRIEELIGLHSLDVFRAAKLMLGGDPPPPTPGSTRYGGLLDTSGLERFVLRQIPWGGIDRNLKARHLSALSVSATHVGTGHTTVFISAADGAPKEWSRDPFVRHRETKIGPLHVMASAAIPLLFPAVKIGDEYFTDGGLRQNTPMSPAIRLGADRLLLISLRHIARDSEALQRERVEAYPKPLFMVGKALNALMLDHTEYDLARLQRLNHILDAGESAFGPEFKEVMNRQLMHIRGAPLRRLDAVHVRPSEDIGGMAADFVARGRVNVKGRVARRIVERLAAGETRHESDLLSYLLFDGDFAGELIALGRRDAAEKEDELAKLFSLEPGRGTIHEVLGDMA
jgi:NTE family protein